MALLVPVDHHIPGGSATGDDVEFSVLVEVGNLEVLTGHLVVIEKVSLPFTFLDSGVKFDADFPLLIRITPARDDLKRAGSKDVSIF